jgi:hypothetical protein
VSFHFYDLNNVTERIAAVIRTVPLLIALLVAGPAFAQSQPDALTLELRALATDFAKIINKQGGGAVAIGEFSASSDVKGSVGPRIQMVLADSPSPPTTSASKSKGTTSRIPTRKPASWA